MKEELLKIIDNLWLTESSRLFGIKIKELHKMMNWTQNINFKTANRILESINIHLWKELALEELFYTESLRWSDGAQIRKAIHIFWINRLSETDILEVVGYILNWKKKWFSIELVYWLLLIIGLISLIILFILK